MAQVPTRSTCDPGPGPRAGDRAAWSPTADNAAGTTLPVTFTCGASPAEILDRLLPRFVEATVFTCCWKHPPPSIPPSPGNGGGDR